MTDKGILRQIIRGIGMVFGSLVMVLWLYLIIILERWVDVSDTWIIFPLWVMIESFLGFVGVGLIVSSGIDKQNKDSLLIWALIIVNIVNIVVLLRALMLYFYSIFMDRIQSFLPALL